MLGDIVGPAAGKPDACSPAGGSALSEVTGTRSPRRAPAGRRGSATGSSCSTAAHRFGGGIAALAGRNPPRRRRGDAGMLADPVRRRSPGSRSTSPSADAAMALGRCASWRWPPLGLVEAARAGDAALAIDALGGFRILCAHRRGPTAWRAGREPIESWLEAELQNFSAAERWYVGRPLLVTAERLRAAPLQRGHRGDRPGARRHASAPPSSARGRRSLQPCPARRRRHRLRDDHPQEPGLAVRRRRGAAPRVRPRGSSRGNCSTPRSPARRSG